MITTRSHTISQFAGRLMSLFRHITCWQWRRSAIAELSALDDRTLKDIGLYRSMIPFVVHEAGFRGGCRHVGL